MKELIESMSQSKEEGGDKLAQVKADIKAVAAEMGMSMEDVLGKIRTECCEEDDNEDVMDDGMSDEEKNEDPRPIDGKKAIVIAMMKRKNGKM